MDYLLKYSLNNVPETYELNCYYIVDNRLQWVSLADDEYFYLHFVDANNVGESVLHDTKQGTLDKYVYNMTKPIISMECGYENVNDCDIRVVKIISVSGNPKSKKHRTAEEKTVFNRYQQKGKKLF